MPGKPSPERDRARQDWEAAFGLQPPPYLSVAFMQQALAYEAQCKRSGRLPAANRRALQKIAAGKPVAEVTGPVVRPGAHLVREWNGRSYQVEVTADGFRMDGKRWQSLSAIAKHITGTSWSGPRFFGITDRAGASS